MVADAREANTSYRLWLALYRYIILQYGQGNLPSSPGDGTYNVDLSKASARPNKGSTEPRNLGNFIVIR